MARGYVRDQSRKRRSASITQVNVNQPASPGLLRVASVGASTDGDSANPIQLAEGVTR